MSRRTLSRRGLLQAGALSAAGLSAGLLPRLANAMSEGKERRHCILLWMTGGPSQLDTFDLKEGHANGGEFREIATSAAGLRFSEHLPRLARQAENLCVLRGLSTREGDHGRGTYLMRTGRSPGEFRYPTLGSFVSKELGEDSALPNFVAVGPRAFDDAAWLPGYLGPRHAPLWIESEAPPPPADGETIPSDYARLGVGDLASPLGVGKGQTAGRLKMLHRAQDEYAEGHQAGASRGHDTALRRAVRLMEGEAAEAFDLSRETDKTRDDYGRGIFGQGCLLARRLVERGVPFVEVSLGEFGRWDTHRDNFRIVRELSAELDAGWSSLMAELAERGMLESTTILWMGEFGRTPQINGGAGRDHYPQAWSAVLAGGGVKGGQAFGRTGRDGMEVEEGRIEVGDLLATLCRAAGVDPRLQNISEGGRPFRLAEGSPIEAVLR